MNLSSATALLGLAEQRAGIERCERGERGDTGGVVVSRLDRFARSAVDALESIKRLNTAGARLVSVEDNFDSSTPMGRFAIGILTLIVELELTTLERRQLMHGLLEKVVLTRSDGRKKATQKPIDEWTTIVLRGRQELRPVAIDPAA